MVGPGLGLFLDGLILVLLGVTIFYAIRLTKSINTFRRSRAELGNLLEDLSNNIAQAEQAILGMKEAARESGKELQDVIEESKDLREELRFMNEAGNNLASRLGDLAEKSRAVAEGHGAVVPDEDVAEEKPVTVSTKKAATNGKAAIQPPVFNIRDPDFDKGEAPEAAAPVIEEGDDPADTGTFQSKAERELFEALQKSSGKKAGGRK